MIWQEIARQRAALKYHLRVGMCHPLNVSVAFAHGHHSPAPIPTFTHPLLPCHAARRALLPRLELCAAGADPPDAVDRGGVL